MLSKAPPENPSLMLSGESRMEQCEDTWMVQPLQPTGAQQRRAAALFVQPGDKSSLGFRGELPGKYLIPRASSLALN